MIDSLVDAARTSRKSGGRLAPSLERIDE